jgi:hypothetical protein
MNIKTAELRAFQKLASHIKGSGVLPIHGYLKFGGGGICKNVSTSFIRFDLTEADEDMLVPENDLYSLLAVTRSEFINITTAKVGKILLSDTKDKIYIQTPKVAEFNIPPVPETTQHTLSEDFSDALSRAACFAQFIKDMPTYYGYVHIGKKTICAGDGIIGLHYPVSDDFEATIEGTAAKFIASLNPHSYSVSEAYHFFFTDGAQIGLSKSIIGWFDIRKIFEYPKAYEFTADPSDVLSFNQLSMKLTQAPVVTMSKGKFEMNDMLLDKYHEREDQSLTLEAPFTYNPEKMNVLLNAIGGSETEFHHSAPCYFITHKDTKATAFIAKIGK